MINHEPLMTEREAADYLRKPSRTLSQMRYLGRGPAYVKVGGSVRYRLADLDSYVEQHTVRPGAA